ncbi:hypothetical protein EON65_06625 [archaeon]|nr:MAG: hypothetical protein EON65_06625 [archaeon]
MAALSEQNLLSADVETKFSVLKQWWGRHCQSFSLWYLSLNEDQRRNKLLAAIPDLPEKSPFARESSGQRLSPTDLILPEFSQDGMLASHGRLFVLFMTRRLTSSDVSQGDDLKLLKDLYDMRNLPDFSNGTLRNLDTPFVDPVEPEENIRSLGPETSPAMRDTIQTHLLSNRIVRAEVWVAMKIRRSAICGLLESLVEEHYKEVATKPSPSYRQLLEGELTQLAELAKEYEKRQQEVSVNAV